MNTGKVTVELAVKRPAPASLDSFPYRSDQVRGAWLREGIVEAIFNDHEGNVRVLTLTIEGAAELRRALAPEAFNR